MSHKFQNTLSYLIECAPDSLVLLHFHEHNYYYYYAILYSAKRTGSINSSDGCVTSLYVF